MEKLRQKFNLLKFRTKVTLILLLVGMVPLTVLGGYIIGYVHHSVIKSREVDMNNYLAQACTAVEGQKEICDQMMNYFMHDEGVISFLKCNPADRETRKEYYESINNTISAMKYQNRVMEEIMIYSDSVKEAYGQIIFPLEELERKLRSGYINDQDMWYYDEENLEMISIYPMPHYADSESYILIHSNIISLFQSLEQLAVGRYGIHVYGGKEIWNFYGTECIDRSGRVLGFQKNQGDYIWVETSIDYLDVKVVYYFPKEKVDSIFVGVFTMTVFLIGICLVLILVLGRVCSTYIAKPLEMLTQDIQSVNMDTMQAGIITQRKDEIGILITSYNQMMKRIQENYKTRLAQKDLEMKVLQAQINPHFLYNSLSMINWKALEAGEKEISRSVLLLSSFYRTTLNHGKSMNSIKNAIENIRSYLEIQQIMHDDNFQVHYDVDQSLYDYEIPLLIFQPLVENALEHGLDLKEDDDRQIWISVYRENNEIHIRIRDNGIGMSEEKVAHILEYDADGYGVKNVNDRMRLCYGENYPIHVTSQEGVGTSILLCFPVPG